MVVSMRVMLTLRVRPVVSSVMSLQVPGLSVGELHVHGPRRPRKSLQLLDFYQACPRPSNAPGSALL